MKLLTNNNSVEQFDKLFVAIQIEELYPHLTDEEKKRKFLDHTSGKDVDINIVSKQTVSTENNSTSAP